ncbi:unnamed protein product [Tetraodon nigroviridis]|uniref:(spotted green pufferfish) hypothetical protein n=1 Tax=Tetraodon nigroviridis TaxID=99883 RepID=Q4SB86_TETNG|nr:unnamed protein product [Tetraodon nigroviridis]
MAVAARARAETTLAQPPPSSALRFFGGASVAQWVCARHQSCWTGTAARKRIVARQTRATWRRAEWRGKGRVTPGAGGSCVMTSLPGPGGWGRGVGEERAPGVELNGCQPVLGPHAGMRYTRDGQRGREGRGGYWVLRGWWGHRLGTWLHPGLASRRCASREPAQVKCALIQTERYERQSGSTGRAKVSIPPQAVAWWNFCSTVCVNLHQETVYMGVKE